MRISKFSTLLICLFLTSVVRAQGPSLTYHGRILNADGNPLVGSSVQFKVQIRSPGAENCLMYEETQSLDLSTTNGTFVLNLNNGSGTRTDSSGYTFDNIFSNRKAFTFATGACSLGAIYSPSVKDSRHIDILFNDGTLPSFESIPTQSINYSPTSIESLSVGGFNASSLLRVEDPVLGPQVISALSPANADELMKLILGTTIQYLKPGAAAGSFTGNLLGDVTGTQGSTVVSKIRGVPVSGTTPLSGQVLKFDGSQWVPSVASAGNVTSVASSDSYLVVANGSSSAVLTVNVGNTAGSVAAGDDSRILGAIQPTTAALGDLTGSTFGNPIIANNAVTDAKISGITTPGKVSGDAITGGTIAGTTAMNTSGNITTSGGISANYVSGNNLRVYNAAHYIQLTSPVLTSDYNLILPESQGGANQVMANDGSGNLVWKDLSALGGVASISGTAPIVVSGSSSAPTISVNAASTTLSGVVTLASDGTASAGTVVQADDSRLTNSRSPTGGASGDLSGTYPNPTVSKLNGSPLSVTALAVGNFLKYDGTSWVNVIPSSADLSNDSNLLKASNMPANCGAGQSLTFSSPSGTWQCLDIVVTAANFGVQSASAVLAGPVSGGSANPTFRSLVETDLPSGVVTGGTYKSVTVDTYGRVTNGTNPTTLTGYGITDAVRNLSGVGNMSAGLDASKPVTAVTGDLYVATDVQKIYRYNGTSWDLISSASGSGGTITALTNDVTASGSGSVSATVNSVGGSAAADVHSAEMAANAATNLNTASTIVKRDASGNFTAGAISANLTGNVTGNLTGNVAGNLTGNVTGSASLNVLKSGDAMTGTLGLAPLATDPSTSGWNTTQKGYTWFNTTSNQVKYWDGSAIQALGVSGAGLTSLNGQSGSTQTFASATTGTDFGISSTGNVHTFSLPSSSATNRGLLTSADWSTFNGKLTSTLTSGQIFVGNVSNVATGVALSGDATISNAGALTLNTVPLTKGGTGLTAGGTSNQVLGINNAGTAAEYKSITAGTGVTITNAANSITITAAGTGGTVTSVGLALPSELTVTNSPVTTSGTLTGSWTSQTAKKVFAAPQATAGAPTFRNLNIADIQSSIAGGFLSGIGCTAGQALTYSLVTDTISCSTIVPTVSNAATLASAKVWVGDATNKAQEVALSGDATISNAGALTLASSGATTGTYTKVTVDAKGRVTVGASIASSDVTTALGYTPVNKAGDAMTGTLGLAPLTTDPSTSGWNTTQKGYTWFNTTSNQVKYWDGSAIQALGVSGAGLTSLNGQSGSTQTFASATTGTDFGISSTGNVHTFSLPSSSATNRGLLTSADWSTFNGKLTSTLTSGQIFVGNVSNVATGVALSGDATISNAGALTLATSGATAGAYKSVTVDAKGRVTAGTNPTTLSGFGITDAVGNTGGIPSMSSGLEAAIPTAGTTGRIFVATDTKRQFRDNGTSWDQLNVNANDLSSGTLPAARLPAFTGDVTSTAGSSALTLASSGATAGTYTKVTVDAKGRVTAGASLASSDVTTALTYTPVNKAGDAMTGTFGLAPLATDPSTAGWNTTQKGYTWFNTTSNQVKYWDGSAIQALGVSSGSGLTSLNGQTGSTQTFASATTGTDFSISSTGNVHTFSLPSSSAANRGLLTSADWSTFNGKLTSTLTSGQIFVGNVSNVATGVALSGDATISNAGALTVAKIKGTSVSATPTTSGQVLRYDGTNWTPNFVAMTDLRSTVTGTTAFASSCLSSQTLTYDSTTDSMSCSNIAIASTQVSGLATSATTDATNAGNISSGTLALDRGGTGTATGSITGTGALVMAAGGTNQNVTLTPSGTGYTLLNGNVGIGTSTPATNLDVLGSVRVYQSAETAVTAVNSTATYAIPDVTRNIRRITLNANTTITLPPVTSLGTDDTYTLTVKLLQDGTGSRTVTWAASGTSTIKWDGSSAPIINSTANKETIFQFTAFGASAGVTIWYGSMVWKE